MTAKIKVRLYGEGGQMHASTAWRRAPKTWLRQSCDDGVL
jgi:hypothetical protein